MARLREDDRAAVYLAEDPEGSRVEVVWMLAEADPDRFAEAIGELGTVSSAPLVHIISSGIAEDRPYVVTEHVAGVSLREAVARDGAMAGPALHRLAVSTMTALVALHQAGIAHGDLHPGTVLLGPDGIRVAGYGLERAMPIGDDMATRALSALAYVPPERLTDSAVEPPGDLFAWAATMLYAATGRDVFDGGSTSATINRILGDEPDLDALDEHLRDVAAACLTKDPAARPQAGDALLALVGHSLLTIDDGDLPHGTPPGPPSPDPAPNPWRRRLRYGVGALVIAATGAVAGHFAAAAALPEKPRSSAAASPTLPDLERRVAMPSAPPAPVSELPVPGVKMTLREHPDDPLRVVAYRAAKGVAYLRAPGSDQFTPAGLTADDVSAHPDGTRVAFLAEGDKNDKGTLTIIDRANGERFEVAVPGSALRPIWNRPGDRILLTLFGDAVDGRRKPTGFAVVDVASRKVTEVDTDDESRRADGTYVWLPDGSGVAVGVPTERGNGLLIRDLTGRETRTMDWVGVAPGRPMYSPSGRLFLTHCPSGGTLCAWDAATGVRQAVLVITFPNAEFWGWYDENHLIVLDANKKPAELVAMDFLGRRQRVVATIDSGDAAEFLQARARR